MFKPKSGSGISVSNGVMLDGQFYPVPKNEIEAFLKSREVQNKPDVQDRQDPRFVDHEDERHCFPNDVLDGPEHHFPNTSTLVEKKIVLDTFKSRYPFDEPVAPSESITLSYDEPITPRTKNFLNQHRLYVTKSREKEKVLLSGDPMRDAIGRARHTTDCGSFSISQLGIPENKFHDFLEARKPDRP